MPEPIVWHETADEILGTLAAYRARHFTTNARTRIDRIDGRSSQGSCEEVSDAGQPPSAAEPEERCQPMEQLAYDRILSLLLELARAEPISGMQRTEVMLLITGTEPPREDCVAHTNPPMRYRPVPPSATDRGSTK